MRQMTWNQINFIKAKKSQELQSYSWNSNWRWRKLRRRRRNFLFFEIFFHNSDVLQSHFMSLRFITKKVKSYPSQFFTFFSYASFSVYYHIPFIKNVICTKNEKYQFCFLRHVSSCCLFRDKAFLREPPFPLTACFLTSDISLLQCLHHCYAMGITEWLYR